MDKRKKQTTLLKVTSLNGHFGKPLVPPPHLIGAALKIE